MRPKSDIQIGDLWEAQISGWNWNPIPSNANKIITMHHANNIHEVKVVSSCVEFVCIKDRIQKSGYKTMILEAILIINPNWRRIWPPEPPMSITTTFSIPKSLGQICKKCNNLCPYADDTNQSDSSFLCWGCRNNY